MSRDIYAEKKALIIGYSHRLEAHLDAALQEANSMEREILNHPELRQRFSNWPELRAIIANLRTMQYQPEEMRDQVQEKMP